VINENILDSKAITKAINISKAIVNNGLTKASIRKNTTEHSLYTNEVKPLLNTYNDEFGKSPNLYIKSILEVVLNESDLDDNHEIRNFKYWGRILQPYVWGCINLKNSNAKTNPASLSPQLYILIDEEKTRFGFSYGDYLKSTDDFVSRVIQDEKLLEKIYALIKSDSDVDLYKIQKGDSGSIRSFENKIEVNTVDDLKNAWGTRCHLSTFISFEEIDESSFQKLFNSLKEILPIYKEVCELVPNEIAQGIKQSEVLDLELFEDIYGKYIHHCKTSSWLQDEKYKFNFADWVFNNMDIGTQSDDELLNLAIESQEQRYFENSNAKGVNFILSEKRFKDDFITSNDIVYLRALINQSFHEPEPAMGHDMTYPKISAWASCLKPGEYIPYASSELLIGLLIIGTQKENFPKKGFKAFQHAQILLHDVLDNLLDRKELTELYVNHLNRELTPVDWAWIAQDFNLFVTRVIAKEDKKDIAETSQKPPRYWLFAPGRNASKWDEFYEEGIMAIGWDELGDFNNYNSRDEIVDSMREKYNKPSSGFMNDSLCCFDFANTINKGDIIICKKGRQSYIGYGIVTSDYFYDNSKDDFHHIRKVEWIKRGHWEETSSIVLKTLTDITKYPDYVNRLKELLGMQTDKQAYSIEDATSDLFLSTQDFRQYLQLLKAKKNIVLQGPPGVGKTFVSKRLAYSLLGEKDDSKIEMIQFHQSYSYEDFIQGFRPKEEGGFKLSNGIFYNLCKKAESNPDSKYVLIIDEINRGNLSKIFGELLMLIEADKRGNDYELSLTYSPEEKFSAPENLFLIGTMNTADRSIAMVDYALRRRFSFIPLSPEFNKKFEDTLLSAGFKSKLCKNIINRLDALNTEIKSDKNNLGDGYQIGHSYFCPDGNGPYDSSWYNNKIKFEIEPLLKEYWFDEPERVESLVEKLTINN